MQVDIRTRADSVATHRRRRGKGNVRQPLPAPLAPSGKPDSWWRAQVRPPLTLSRSGAAPYSLPLLQVAELAQHAECEGPEFGGHIRASSSAASSKIKPPLQAMLSAAEGDGDAWCGAQVGSPVVEQAWETLCGSIIQEVRLPLPRGARTSTAWDPKHASPPPG